MQNPQNGGSTLSLRYNSFFFHHFSKICELGDILCEMSLLRSFKETIDVLGSSFDFCLVFGITHVSISIKATIQNFIRSLLIILSRFGAYRFSPPRGVFMGFLGESVGSLGRLLRTKEIIIYTSSGCPRCAILKKWLENKNAVFAEKNLEDTDVMADLVMRNAVVLSAPALEVEGAVYTEDQIFDGDGMIDAKILEILNNK